jgi:thymidylate synthase (FAD)
LTDILFRSDVRVELIDSMGGDNRAVQAARVSTKGSESYNMLTGSEGLINYLMREHHEVPFEHSVFTFYIEAPIFVTRQILKHRISSISEESGRYRELRGVFYVPSEERKVQQIGKTGDYTFIESPELSVKARNAIVDASTHALYYYDEMLSQGIAKEVARMVLPVNLYSTMYLTVNARSLMNILALRTSDTGSHPQYEIELVAREMEKLWAEHSPMAYAAFQKHVRGV